MTERGPEIEKLNALLAEGVRWKFAEPYRMGHIVAVRISLRGWRRLVAIILRRPVVIIERYRCESLT
jgi:hypothetical protein